MPIRYQFFIWDGGQLKLLISLSGSTILVGSCDIGMAGGAWSVEGSVLCNTLIVEQRDQVTLVLLI